MKYPMLKLTSIAVLAALGLTACMHEEVTEEQQGSQAKTGYLTSGVITGFGSVFINGVEFETDDALFNIDDADGTESQLKLGMYITLQGDVNADGKSGKASAIKFENDVEGMVLGTTISAGEGTLDVMGQTVTVDMDTKFESDVASIVTIDDLGLNNLVEVSGYSSGDGSIYATRVEVKALAHEAGEEIELKGVISQLTANTFVIGKMTIEHITAQLEDFDGAAMADGMYVEVKSTEGLNGDGHLIASKIELEDEDGKGEKREDGEEMELEGLVTKMVNTEGNLVEINGQQIVLNAHTEFENGSLVDLLVGKKVEVEGEFAADGQFVAKEVKFRAEAKIEMDGLLEAVDVENSTVTVFGQTIAVNNMTVMDDERSEGDIEPVKYFNLTHLAVGDWLELKAYRDDNGQLVAVKLERDDIEEENGVVEVELEGDIESISENGQLTVAGVTVDVSAVEGKQYTQGMKIEIDGTYANGLFTAIQVSVEEDDGLED